MLDDQLEADGLYDPASDDPSRAVLIRRCVEIGMTVEEIRDAGDDLIDRAVQRVLGGSVGQFTLSEVAARAGVSVRQADQIARATGIAGAGPDAVLYGERDVELISAVGGAFEVLGEDAVLQMVRVAAAAVVRIGDAAMSTFLTSVGAPASRDDSGLQLLEANIAALELLPRFGDVLTQMLVRYMQQAYRPSSETAVEAALAHGVDTRVLAIGFADLVGSATLASSQSLADLSQALDVFERTATETITAGGARVVKFIGDEVMFRADTADILCAVSFDLVNFVRQDPLLPPLRVGLAYGEVLSREGDFYGSNVNLAARVTKLAPLHGVVATVETIGALSSPQDYLIDRLGAIEMRGLPEAVELAGLAPAGTSGDHESSAD
jgi:adenylate cyclase